MRLFKPFFLSFVFLSASVKFSLAAVVTVPEENGFAKLSDLTIVFANITSVVSTAAGFAVLIMLIRGGVAYITAQGDPKAVSAARSSLTWALVGLVVIVIAYLIIALFVDFFAVPGVGKFCIPKAGLDISTQCSTN